MRLNIKVITTIKRILEIITFPFSLLFQFILLPFKIVKIIWDDKKEQKKSNSNNITSKNTKEELRQAGSYLFPDFLTEFETYYSLYLNDKRKFVNKNQSLLANYDHFELNKLKPIEVLYIFADSKQKIGMTDWCAEENEREIENFLENNLQIKATWTNVNQLRNTVDESKQNSPEFIIDLLKTIDKDLKPLKKKILFFDLGWDAYVYTVVSQTSYKMLTVNFGTLFHGADKLRN